MASWVAPTLVQCPVPSTGEAACGSSSLSSELTQGSCLLTPAKPLPCLPPKQPNVASTTKKFSYKLVKTGSVVLTASTDLRGYVVGQVLRLQADIENQSGKDTSPVVASLLQVSVPWLLGPVPWGRGGAGGWPPRLTGWPFPRKCPTRPGAGSMTCGPSPRWREPASRPGGGLSGKSRFWCPPCPSPPCRAVASSTWTTICRW